MKTRTGPVVSATYARWRTRVTAVLTRRPVLATLLLAAVYAGAIAAGRSTRVDGSSLALVWPAAAVGFVWLAVFWRAPVRRWATVMVLAAVAGAVNALTGLPASLAAAFAVANGLAAVVSCAVMARWQDRADGQRWRLRRPDDLAALVLASFLGSGAAALVGPVAVALQSQEPLGPLVLAWVLRNGCGTFAFAALALRLGEPVPACTSWRHRGEVTVAAVLIATAYVVVFGLAAPLPLAFLLLPLSLWVALRFDTTLAAWHVMLVGLLVVVATLAGRGPFAMAAGVPTRVLLAQAFVTVVGLVTLVLALYRDERARLVLQSQEQAALLRAVIDTTSDGITVFDATGRVLLRNPASVDFFGDTPDDVPQRDWEEHYGVFRLDGQRWPLEDLPLSHALRGDDVVGVDMVVTTAHAPEPRVIHANAHPLPPAPGAGWHGGAVMAFHDVSAAREAAAETARAHRLVADVLDAATDFATFSTDPHGRLTVFNVGAERMLGLTAPEALGTSIDRFVDPLELRSHAGERTPSEPAAQAGEPDRQGVVPDAVLTTRHPGAGTHSQVWTLLATDGRRVRAMLTLTAMRADDGGLSGFMGVARDITAEAAAQAELVDSEERFRLAFDTAPVGMMIVGLTPGAPGTVLRVNASMPRLLGYTAEELLGCQLLDLLHPADLSGTIEDLHALSTGQLRHLDEDRYYQHADGSVLCCRVTMSVITPEGWEPYAVCLVQDVTAARHAEQALTHQALHDPLTGLPNRALFEDRLGHALAAAERDGDQVGVLFLDLDGFKAVNDTAGHDVGDELLVEVARRLSGCLRPGDTVARLGGDEFTVVCRLPAPVSGTGALEPDQPHIGQPGRRRSAGEHGLGVVAARLLAAVHEPCLLSAGPFTVGVSIGATVAGPAAGAGGQGVETAQETPRKEVVLRRADVAMYAAKRAGRGCVRFSTDAEPDTEVPLPRRPAAPATTAC